MCVNIHLSLADLFKMAAADATATAATAAAAHQGEVKKLQQIIDEQKMEIRRLNQESFASSVAVSQVCDAKIKELTDKLHHAEAATASAANADGVAAAAASDAAAAARVAQEAAHLEETKKLYQMIEEHKVEFMNLKWDSFAAAAKEQNAFDAQIKDLTDRLNDAVYQHGLRAKEDAATIRHLRTALDDVLEAEQEALECVKDEKEQVGDLLESLELAETSRSRATERALAAEEKLKKLAEDFDTSTTFYKMKIEEAEENCERLKKQLKEEGETLEVVSRRECELGQRVREATLRAEKMERNFLRLCGAIDLILADVPDYRKKLWDQYITTNAYPLMPWEERVLDYRRTHPSTWVPTPKSE